MVDHSRSAALALTSMVLVARSRVQVLAFSGAFLEYADLRRSGTKYTCETSGSKPAAARPNGHAWLSCLLVVERPGGSC